MRLFVVATLLLAHACARAAQAPARPAALPPCAQAVRFAADWFPDPPREFDKTSEFLVRQGAPAGEGATALGLVTVDNVLSVAPEKGCRGLRVQLSFAHPVLRVIRDLPPGTCAHAHVLRHEQTHVQIYREMARQFRALAYPFPEAATAEAVLRYARQQLAQLQEQQRQFDSPEEYARNLTACRGQIVQLLAAAAKKG